MSYREELVGTKFVPNPRLLLVENDPLTRRTITMLLESYALIIGASSLQEALLVDDFDLALIDLDLDQALEGFALVERCQKLGRYCAILTGHGQDQLIEKGYCLGCHDYLVKPVSSRDLTKLLERYHCWLSGRQFEIAAKGDSIHLPQGLCDVSGSDLPILLSGETGTGKGHLARLIHKYSRKGPLVHINCAELSESLLGSELFGHVKGAFTGAVKDRTGKMKEADGGTLFLDEIGAMNPSLQGKLLKALEEKRFYPIGSDREMHSNFRLICATCDCLDSANFRLDLYHRIAGYHYRLSSLREDVDRIWSLVSRILEQSARKVIFKKDARDIMNSYSWPGNIRELMNFLEKINLSGHGVIDRKILAGFGIEKKEVQKSNLDEVRQKGLRAYIRSHEREIVTKIVKENGGAVRKSLKVLKISNGAYYNLIGRDDG